MGIAAQQQRIRSNYKQTEVGIIPEDWRLVTVKEVAAITTGKRNTQDRIQDGAYPFFVRSQTIERINSYSYDGEAVLTAGDGVGTGKVFHYIKGKFDFHQRVYKISDFRRDVQGFYFYFYFSTHFYDRIMSMTAKSSVDSVRLEMIADMPIPAPPEPEQRAIGAALNDVDALVSALDKLIAKKRDVKQAAMQQLLTGKRRLPGFSEEWKTRTLGDEIEQLEAGVSVNSIDDKLPGYAHEHAILKTSCVSNGRFLPQESKTIDPEDLKRAKLNPRADSLIISRMNTPDLVGECGYVGENYPFLYLPDRLWMTRVNRESRLVVKWLSYLLNHEEYKIKIKGAATGTSGSMKNIAKDSLLSIVIPFPAPEEQRAIATVLFDIDADIVGLEARRDKIRALKQGMMQELLTGNIRLV